MPATDREAGKRLALAGRLAREAGRILLDRLGRLEREEITFKGRRDLCTAADRASEAFLLEHIHRHHPGEPILAEEGLEDYRARGDEDLLWVLDPLDGTTNFVHHFPLFAVSVGIWRRGRPWLGAVHLPCSGETFTGLAGGGAWLAGKEIALSRETELDRALLGTGFPYDRSEPGAETNLDRFGRALLAAQGIRRTGSVCIDLCWLAAGRLDGFWELGLGPHDLGAAPAIVLGAGGVVTDLAGGADYLRTGRIVAAGPGLHDKLLALVGDGAEDGESH